MKTLVLCVDRDDDLGQKAGLKGPIVGREDNLQAATRLGLADPEDSDVNAILSAVSIYDDLVKAGTPAEVATITGDTRVGPISDRNITRQLDEVIEWSQADRAYLVSDGAEDEAIHPVIASRLRIDHVRRVYVHQARAVESTFYVLRNAVKDPKVRRKVVLPFGLSVILFALVFSRWPQEAVATILVLFGVWVILISMPWTLGELLKKPGEMYDRVRESAVQGNVGIFFNLAAVILLLIAFLVGLDSSGAATDSVQQFLLFVAGSVFWLMLSVLTYEGGKVATAYLQNGRVPRHVLVVASTFVALGLLGLALTNVLSTVFGAEPVDVSLILGTVGLAILLIILSGVTNRAGQEPEPEDAWRR